MSNFSNPPPDIVKIELVPFGHEWLIHIHRETETGGIDTETRPAGSMTRMLYVLGQVLELCASSVHHGVHGQVRRGRHAPRAAGEVL